MSSILSDPKKVSVSTEVDGMDNVRLAKIELMEELLFFSWRCRCGSITRGDSVATIEAAAKFEARDSSSSTIRCIMMRFVLFMTWFLR